MLVRCRFELITYHFEVGKKCPLTWTHFASSTKRSRRPLTHAVIKERRLGLHERGFVDGMWRLHRGCIGPCDQTYRPGTCIRTESQSRLDDTRGGKIVCSGHNNISSYLSPTACLYTNEFVCVQKLRN